MGKKILPKYAAVPLHNKLARPSTSRRPSVHAGIIERAWTPPRGTRTPTPRRLRNASYYMEIPNRGRFWELFNPAANIFCVSERALGSGERAEISSGVAASARVEEEQDGRWRTPANGTGGNCLCANDVRIGQMPTNEASEALRRLCPRPIPDLLSRPQEKT
jgi:hypothetical protein